METIIEGYNIEDVLLVSGTGVMGSEFPPTR